MSTRNAAAPPAPAATFAVRKVSFDAPWHWLAAGWRDLWATPVLSLGYGVAFSAISTALVFGLSLTRWYSLVLVLAGGFLILAPMLAIGLYEISRRREQGLPVNAAAVIGVKPRSAGQLAFMGFVLLFLFGAWLRIALLLFAIFFGTATLPPIDRFVSELLFTPHGLGMLCTGTVVGGALALLAFVISAVSIPLMMAEDADVFTAMATSVQAVAENKQAMVLWAVLIAGIIACGLATLFVGLIVAYPLVGHATWHAYRALVTAEAPAGATT